MEIIMPDRIDARIKKHFGVANSEEYTEVKKSADATIKHGFTKSANVKYAEFLDAFRSDPARTKDYSERYPQCTFLPWDAFHAIRKSMELWVDLPQNYLGAVPPEQTPWLDVFEFDDNDRVFAIDAISLLEMSAGSDREGAFRVIIGGEDELRRMDMMRFGDLRRNAAFMQGHGMKISHYYTQFRDNFFVVAPPDAFGVKEDFISRFNKLVDEIEENKVPPNDPLVVRFCKGGCLVVAAWGDEAAQLNGIAQELKLND